MQIVDSFVVNAPQEKVWDLLFNIPRLSRCVPGLQSIEVVDDKTYRGKVVVKVGPIKAEFSATGTLREVAVPRTIAGTVEGDDCAGGSSVKAACRAGTGAA